MKYKVRYELEGFVTSETFESEDEARNYYNKVMNDLGNYILEIDMWEVR